MTDPFKSAHMMSYCGARGDLSPFLKIYTLYSCNIGEGGIALAEAVHGSAPDIAGKVRNS